MRSWQRISLNGSIDNSHPSLGGPIIFTPDRNWLLRAIAGDCNGDGISNQCEIENGAPDLNANGIPDECERLCPPDLSPLIRGDGIVDIDDLVILMTSWNRIHSPADLNIDGVVDIDDLVLLITHWGPCG